MTSKAMRDDPLFMRNTFSSVGKWGIPLVHKQEFPTNVIQLVACSDTRANDNEENKKKGVHFFVDDYRFSGIYNHPDRSLERYAQYAFLLTPDFSTYADMDLWRQLESVAKKTSGVIVLLANKIKRIRLCGTPYFEKSNILASTRYPRERNSSRIYLE